ncbi:Cytoplasmic dynein 1 intermediate chain 1 [Takifugu flavidus]|uniref:Cytoplasmic dynein 1 intermediate chain 1 n=1 Tax=Takifugu flavidus TaxID=433684 RepID=A0A5C6NFA7_9TELE|nr:Cytoplasmic dynein 1 intermediate chain 1 [Takifugu flavidus]
MLRFSGVYWGILQFPACPAGGSIAEAISIIAPLCLRCISVQCTCFYPSHPPLRCCLATGVVSSHPSRFERPIRWRRSGLGSSPPPVLCGAQHDAGIMSDKSDLKAELERKKQRLAQIREEKKRKEEERKKKESDNQKKRETTPEDSDLDRKRRETEALLQSIGISPEPSLVPTPVSPSKSVSTPSETGSQDSADGGAASRSGFSQYQSHAQSSRTLQWDTDPSVLQLQADSELGRRMQRLGASKITQVDFLPREMVSYSKETQTPLNAHLSEGELNVLGHFKTPATKRIHMARLGKTEPRRRVRALLKWADDSGAELQLHTYQQLAAM